ncbi:TAXI family TRAP transporter solute-binding subunit [Embleya sp. NBC_00896]|uniref:TAXI family TRAP transporter solute-binding subunit n=1 Tax=Embleya sp. NBC_00896 TaxID=2975961 RepID=UPI003869434E|nr:TAXI family TRAP transporter solute-binding subunit [Embleya sp. NBC_00896]
MPSLSFVPLSIRDACARRPRLVRAVVATLVLMCLVGTYAVLSSDDEAPHGGPVSLATGVPTGVYHRYGELLRPRLSADLKVKVTVNETGGSVQNLRRVIAGSDTFGIATSDAVADLGPGDRDQLRAVARLYDDYVQLVVPAGSPVQNIGDLRGRRVVVGLPGSGVELITRRLLSEVGMADMEHAIEPVRIGIAEATQRLRDGSVDAFFWSGGLPTGAVADLAAKWSVRLVKLGDLANRLRERYGPVYREAVVPADAYPGGAETATIAVPNLLVTTAAQDPALIRRVTETVMENREAIGREVHAAQLVDPRTAIFTDPLPLHEGAERWYKSVKP